MIPVILLLLYFLVKAIWILLGLYSQIKVQREISSTLKALVRDYSDECIKDTQIKLQATGESIVSEYLKRIIEHKHDSRYCEHELFSSRNTKDSGKIQDAGKVWSYVRAYGDSYTNGTCACGPWLRGYQLYGL